MCVWFILPAAVGYQGSQTSLPNQKDLTAGHQQNTVGPLAPQCLVRVMLWCPKLLRLCHVRMAQPQPNLFA